MERINVVGTSGSGKTTFAKALAEQLNCPLIEMDALFWKANWTESSDEEFFAKLTQAVAPDCWVLDGNYHRSAPIKWREVDTIIWLDLSFIRTIWQALKRAIARARSGEELWSGTGNCESWRMLFSRDSIILWTIRNYRSNKRRYKAIMSDPTYDHIQFVHLTTPAMCQQFLSLHQQHLSHRQ